MAAVTTEAETVTESWTRIKEFAREGNDPDNGDDNNGGGGGLPGGGGGAEG